MGLRPLTCWDCGFECRLSVVSVVRSQVKSLRRDDPSSRGVLPNVVFPTGCDGEDSIMMRPWPTRITCALKYIYISGEW